MTSDEASDLVERYGLTAPSARRAAAIAGKAARRREKTKEARRGI